MDDLTSCIFCEEGADAEVNCAGPEEVVGCKEGVGGKRGETCLEEFCEGRK